MPVVEQLFSPGCSLPACRCERQMHAARNRPLPAENHTHIQIYVCSVCHHQMHLTVWGGPEAEMMPLGGLDLKSGPNRGNVANG